MRKLAILLVVLIVSLMVIGTTKSYSSVNIVYMSKAEKTGNRTHFPPPPQEGPQLDPDPLPWYYEIKIEWGIYHLSGPNVTSDLYRRNSPGVYPNGVVIANDVSGYDYDTIWDDLCWPPPGCFKHNVFFRHYDWAREGYTWYYMAEGASNEVSVAVP